ncbi:MAG: hypothetical protein PHS45_00090 [Bacilli bacterium]|nr:hypothetical protein [Bacilli bacterium]
MQYGQYQPAVTGMPTPGMVPGQYDMAPMGTPFQQFGNIDNRLSRLEQQVRRLNARVSRLETAIQEPAPGLPPQFQTTQPFDMTEGNYPSTYMM